VEHNGQPAAPEPASSRVALVTAGIDEPGRSVAVELARRGWSVFLQHNAPPEIVADVVDDILQAAGQAGLEIEVAAGQADLANAEDREQLVESVLEEFAQIDMLVNVAAAGQGAPVGLLEMTEQDFRQMMDDELIASLFTTQIVANEMVRLAEAGLIETPKIVTINSITASAACPDRAAECISRAAMSMMTPLFADRLGEHGINAYEVRVGFQAGSPTDQSGHARHDQTLISRWGRPGDVARAVAAIAEDLLDFSTGQVINVDGGFHLRRL